MTILMCEQQGVRKFYMFSVYQNSHSPCWAHKSINLSVKILLVNERLLGCNPNDVPWAGVIARKVHVVERRTKRRRTGVGPGTGYQCRCPKAVSQAPTPHQIHGGASRPRLHCRLNWSPSGRAARYAGATVLGPNLQGHCRGAGCMSAYGRWLVWQTFHTHSLVAHPKLILSP